MRYLVFLALACGPASPMLAPLELELEDRGPAGRCALGLNQVAYDAGVVWPDPGVRDTWWAIVATLDAGELASAPTLKAPVGTVLSFIVLAPEYLDDGGCEVTRTVSDAGLKLRAVYHSDSDGGIGRHQLACEFLDGPP